MKCKFYGTSPAFVVTTDGVRPMAQQFPESRILVPQGGNQCGLIVESFSPCRMEEAGLEVDFDECELKGSARAEQFKDFERREFIRLREVKP